MFRFIDTLLFTFERIRQHRVLVLWVIVGLSVATTLALSLPLYVDSVFSDVLSERLDDPPYAFRYRYLGAWNGNINPDDFQNATTAVQTGFSSTIGLPTYREVTYVKGGVWSARKTENNFPLGTFGVGALQGADDQIFISAGDWSAESLANYGEEDPVPILAPETMLYNLGLNLGDGIIIQRAGVPPVLGEVVALWRPVNPNDPSWIFTPKFFDQVFLVEKDTLWRMIDGIDGSVDEAGWFLNFNGSELLTSDIDNLIAQIGEGERNLEIVLPGIREDLSPTAGLRDFSQEVNALTQQLFIIILPVGGLVLYFVSLVAGLLVRRQQGEDVKLRSRGMSRWAILSVHVLMWLILVWVALAMGIGVSPFVVQIVGQTTSFLQIDSTLPLLEIVLTPQALLIGTATGLIAASSGLFFAWRSTRQNINSFKQELSRGSKAWWQRMYLDIMLLVPAIYVLFQLTQQGGIVTEADNPFGDPLTFIGPTLFALGACLLFLRVLPILLNVGARAMSYTKNIALLMALRELTRSMSRYRGALLMMAFTLSLTGFTASMASTLDQSLTDSINYRVGADAVMIIAADTQTEENVDSTTGQAGLTVVGYNTPPIEELQGVQGITQASRVGEFEARLEVRNQRLEGTLMGVDRGAMAAVTRFREDYAPLSSAELFNQLAGNRTGLLVNTQTAVENNILIGQEVGLQVFALGQWYETRVPVVGVVDYFPTLDPRTSFFAIGNIDPIFELVGTELPHDIWVGLQPTADLESVQQEVTDLEFPVLRWLDPESALREAQADPSRRGVLGFLSVGFIASIVLTLIGAVIQSTASFRAQSAQLGSLRAMGLGSWSVGIYMILLQGMSAFAGILSGTTIGLMTTLLFLPLLDFSGGLPPYLIRVAWNEILIVYSVFAGVLFFVTLLTSLLLSREQLSTVVKLGEV